MEAYLNLLRAVAMPLLEGHLPPPELLKALLSKTLGYGIVMGASIVKLPQVSNVISARSADGLSAVTFEMEQIVFSVTMLYGFIRGMPFSSYGEAFLLLLQNCVLLALIYHHNKANKLLVLIKIGLFTSAIAAAFAGFVPKDLVQTVYDLTLIIMISARVPQILKASRERSTGKLSIITTGLNLLGTLARVFTSLADEGGYSMVRNYIIAGILHSISFSQIIYYGDQSISRKKGSAEKNE